MSGASLAPGQDGDGEGATAAAASATGEAAAACATTVCFVVRCLSVGRPLRR